jgi:hypothetical protein
MGRYGLNLAAAQHHSAQHHSAPAACATSDQVSATQVAGAEWCWAGGTQAGGTQAGGTGPGIQVFSATPAATDTFGINLYGPKPSQGAYPVCGSGATACVLPFSSTKWSQYAP